MKSFFNLLKVGSVAVLLSSCAYENDPGIGARVAEKNAAKNQEKDVLNGKSSSEILSTKYKALGLTCTLSEGPEAPTAATVEGDSANPPVDEKPIDTTKGYEVKVNYVALAAQPEDFKNNIKTELVLDGADKDVKVEITIKPLSFLKNASLKVDNKFYVMKYSPALDISYKYSSKSSNGSEEELPAVSQIINEKISNKATLKSELVGGVKIISTVVCNLDSTADADKADLQGQWIDVDCSKTAVDYEKDAARLAAFKTGCKPAGKDGEEQK